MFDRSLAYGAGDRCDPVVLEAHYFTINIRWSIGIFTVLETTSVPEANLKTEPLKMKAAVVLCLLVVLGTFVANTEGKWTFYISETSVFIRQSLLTLSKSWLARIRSQIFIYRRFSRIQWQNFNNHHFWTGHFLPFSRGRISAPFLIENSHLFSQYHVCFSQLREVFFLPFLENTTTYEKQLILKHLCLSGMVGIIQFKIN